MTIGVGVEGPSDRAFWGGVLHRTLRGARFDIRNMQNKTRLIRQSPQLLEAFRSAHYAATFIIVDCDDARCIPEVLSEFTPDLIREARRPRWARDLFICVAVKELEAWYLADEEGVNLILPRGEYRAVSDTSEINAEKVLSGLWRKHYATSLNKIEFAKEMSKFFNPDRAQRHSRSFQYLWQNLSEVAGR